jgi:hypothetical protein
LRAECAHCLCRILLHGDELDEVVDAEAAAHAGHAAGGQRVVGSGDVVAHGLRGPAAYEDRACVPHPIEIAGRVDGEVLGARRLVILRASSTVEARITRPLRSRARRAIGLLRLRSFASAMTSLARSATRGDEDGERFRIVLGLRYEVGRNIGCVAALAGYDNLGGAGEHVDGAVESYQALGRGDVEIAGADNFVYALEGCGSVCQGGDGVRTAETIELRDTEQMRGGQGFRRGFG